MKRQYAIGDLIQVGGTRWTLRALVGENVTLISTNHIHHTITWRTTLDKLPEAS